MPKKNKLIVIKKPSKDVKDGSISKHCCPVPLIECSVKVNPKNDPGIKMNCSNESCTHSKTPVHTACFNNLEANLIKALKKSGPSRKWTDVMCQENLWTRKTMFLDRLLVCKCETGWLTVDKKEINGNLSSNLPKIKKKNELPRLNFGGRPNIRTKADIQEFMAYKAKEKALEEHHAGQHSDDEFLESTSPTEKVAIVKKKAYIVDTRKDDDKPLDQPEWIKQLSDQSPSNIATVAKERFRRISELRKSTETSTTLEEEDLELIKSPQKLPDFFEGEFDSDDCLEESEIVISSKTSVDMGIGSMPNDGSLLSSVSNSPANLSYDNVEFDNWVSNHLDLFVHSTTQLLSSAIRIQAREEFVNFVFSMEIIHDFDLRTLSKTTPTTIWSPTHNW